MNRADVAIEALMQIAMARWLRHVHPWAMRAAWVCVPYTWLFALASYWRDGTWPRWEGVTLFLTLSFPVVALPLMALVFRRALQDGMDGHLGFAAFKSIVIGIPITMIILALDALILLASVRAWLMTGDILPAL
jgi:hypothetical protein